MSSEINLDHCLSFINCQLQPHRGVLGARQSGQRRRAITISRQSGSGGHAVAEKLWELLNAGTCQAERWAVFDRNLVERVLEEHHLPARWARFMPEDKISEISDTMDELFGLHPPSWTLVRKTADTILHVAELGNVIIIGRGASVITRRLDNVLHVRLVGSLERRVAYLERVNQLTRKEALALAQAEDLGRRRYLKKYFDKNIDDPLLYHLVINTDLLSYEEAAHLIVDALGPEPAEVEAVEMAV